MLFIVLFQRFDILGLFIFQVWMSFLSFFDLEFGFSAPKYLYKQVLSSVEASFTAKATTFNKRGGLLARARG